MYVLLMGLLVCYYRSHAKGLTRKGRFYIMIRHILFWNYTDTVRNQHREAEALQFLQDSVATMNGHIDGLLKAEIGTNLAGGYDLVFYAELEDTDALNAFRDHPLHAAHRERCKDIVTDRLCGDLITTI